MENFRLPIWIANILGVMLIIFVALLSLQQIQVVRNGSQLLSVSATTKVESIPDLATVTIGVLSEGTTAKAVKDQSSAKMNQLIAFTKQLGIEDRDIKTSQFYIAPKYNYSNQQQTQVGYQANQTISVKVRNIDKSAKLLEALVDGAVINGANQIQGIDFSFADNEIFVQQARKQAIEKAKINAQQIAADSGLKLGRIVNVITGSNDSPVPIYAANMAMAKSSGAQIELGSQEISASVTVLFKLR